MLLRGFLVLENRTHLTDVGAWQLIRPGLALAASSVQYSNARGREKERYIKVESRREKESESVDPKHMRVVIQTFRILL
ncbi:hypothetical protein EVAR_54185_1 [Eumeta japonica]|uniref:Uncharacterized protein n=1 Tax=Eumeta variegata TaxID=151549 RepID=A0A4C1ZCE8_EUMVA|nr:hypothetical protein EVAR_54185_1 [Eumeta japonica]